MVEWTVTVAEEPTALHEAIDFDPDTAAATPFQHPRWLACWARVFGDRPDGRIFVVVVRTADTGAVVMRLPLSLETISGVRVVRSWDRGTSDCNGPILTGEIAPAAFAAVWRQVLAVLPACDVVVIDKMPERLGDRPNPLLGLGGVTRSFNSSHGVQLAAATGRAASDGFDGAMMRSLARKRRKLVNKGALVFRMEPAGAAREALECLLDWRRERFAEENEGRDTAAVEAFYRALADEPEIARIGALSLGGRTIAAGFGTRTRDTFQLLAIGFDTAWKNWSPGLLLIDDMVARAEADGLRLFDFTIGAEAYKRNFDVTVLPLHDLHVPRTLKGTVATFVRRRRIAKARRAAASAEAASPG